MNNKVHTPLFTILKRDALPTWKGLLIRFGAGLIAFVISILIASSIIVANPLQVTGKLFQGAFKMPWRLMFDTAILLGFGVAIVPAFKMKYWNMGANGQVMIGCLAACVVMFYTGTTKIPSGVIIVLMLIVAILAATIWAVIPAIFKAFFNTNETLFTLMTNYIAIAIVSFINYVMANGKQDNPGSINLLYGRKGWMPSVIDSYFIPIVIIVLIAIFMYFYIKYTVHGFQVSVLGDSPSTARYVNMNTKWIIIRTLIVSGVICGILGFIYASAIDHSVSGNTGGSLGFTGILVAWLSNFNPIIMAGVSFILAFISNGTSKISADYQMGSNNLSSVVIGIVFFSLLFAEFIIRYKVKFNFVQKKQNVALESEVK